MQPLINDRFLRAALRQPVDTTPVWVMRQAGRYLPEYRATRARAGHFMALCQNPELACEVTLQPLERFDLDAAILFSDILTIPDAMGLKLRFAEGEGPIFDRPIRSVADIDRLAVPDMGSDLRYVVDATRLIRRELNGRVPLIGFSGSPWTLASYMIEGQGSRDFRLAKRLILDEPAAAERLLAVLVDSVSTYLNAQIAAGAQAVMIFDTWGGMLAPAQYQRFSLAPMQQIAQRLTREQDGRRVPVIFFTKNGGAWLDQIASAGCDAAGVDWTTDLAVARQRCAGRIALQGNLDPCTLYASPEVIRAEVARVLDSYGDGPGHIFNLGHGILPDVPADHVKVLVDAVHELGRGRAERS